MKKLKTLFAVATAITVMCMSMILVSADTATDLKSMTVYAVSENGDEKEVTFDFNSTTYEYDLTVMSDTKSIKIEAEAADDSSTWKVDKDGINTKMDFGENKTQVIVTSASGDTNTYTLNTTRLTEEEQETYQGSDTAPSDVTVKVGKTTYTIASSFAEGDIPEGFKKDTAEYKGESLTCIKGEKKDITAFYLVNDESQAFFIYNSEADSFYPMNNIQIKSRMYTIIHPDNTESVLKNYTKKDITIIDQEVSAWVLNEEEGMYLVYAMNWNGDTNLYCYDDQEKCFQRYPISGDTNSQIEAANKAYNNLQDKYNSLVDKYNILLKIVCALAIVIIILLFVCINLGISKKAKALKDNVEEDHESKTKKEKKNKKDKNEDNEDVDDIDDIDAEAEELPDVEEATEKVSEEPEEEEEFDDIDESEALDDIEEKPVKRKLFGKKNIDRTYGDEPTFGSEKESQEGF